jgi:hypothetical protein
MQFRTHVIDLRVFPMKRESRALGSDRNTTSQGFHRADEIDRGDVTKDIMRQLRVARRWEGEGCSEVGSG